MLIMKYRSMHEKLVKHPTNTYRIHTDFGDLPSSTYRSTIEGYMYSPNVSCRFSLHFPPPLISTCSSSSPLLINLSEACWFSPNTQTGSIQAGSNVLMEHHAAWVPQEKRKNSHWPLFPCDLWIPLLAQACLLCCYFGEQCTAWDANNDCM